jgi:hypothetical protein
MAELLPEASGRAVELIAVAMDGQGQTSSARLLRQE